MCYSKVSVNGVEQVLLLCAGPVVCIGNRRLEIDIGGLEDVDMSRLGRKRAGNDENLHFFQGFLSYSALRIRIVR
jgi:hypothetical protein